MTDTKTAITLNPKTTALILIDLQKGIVSFPSEPHSATDVIKNAQKLTGAFHEAHALVILVHVSASPDGKDMLHPDADQPMVRRGEMPKDWAEIVPELTPTVNDLLITKHQWGAFYGTELDLELRRRGITTIVIGGISTNMGVESTARDAYERGYQLIFAEDAMSSMAEADHAFAISRIFPRIGKIRKTQEITTAITA